METKDGKETGMKKAGPVHEVRLGRVVAAVWVNDSEHGNHYSVSVKRTYRDPKGEFKDSRSFSGRDLLLVAKAVELAHGWMYQRGLLRGRARDAGDGFEPSSVEPLADAVVGDPIQGGWGLSDMRSELVVDEAA